MSQIPAGKAPGIQKIHRDSQDVPRGLQELHRFPMFLCQWIHRVIPRPFAHWYFEQTSSFPSDVFGLLWPVMNFMKAKLSRKSKGKQKYAKHVNTEVATQTL